MGPGIYHRVSEGESIWAISQAYDVNLHNIIRANRRLKNPDRIKAGQQIYIPGAKYAKKNIPKTKLDFIWPVQGKIVRRYGKKGNKRYLGIGIKAKEGNPVKAAEAGKVVFISNDFRSYGKIIIIEHSKEYTTVYAHNQANLVKKDQQVKKGEKIALVGRTGWAKSPYLYFEVRYREEPRNPLFILP
ncbi:peptidoglycan DD-metalloendopeptidase family protein [Elusimicrobiota bacterium]